jgi:hypothetical protein
MCRSISFSFCVVEKVEKQSLSPDNSDYRTSGFGSIFTCPVSAAGSSGRCNTIWYKAFFKGGVYAPREAVWAFSSAEERHVASLEGGAVVA